MKKNFLPIALQTWDIRTMRTQSSVWLNFKSREVLESIELQLIVKNDLLLCFFKGQNMEEINFYFLYWIKNGKKNKWKDNVDIMSIER